MENYITKEGEAKLKEELEYLKKTKRREVAERIRAAAAMGDLSENFDYQNAKEDQDLIETRIAELETTLKQSQVVGESHSKEEVQVGSRVTLDGAEGTWTISITGPQEADPLQDKISASAPLGEALIGKKKGETVELDTPGGKAAYKVLEIA